MGARLLVAPRWVRGLVYAVLFGTSMTVLRTAQDGHLVPAS